MAKPFPAASASADQALILWDATTGRALRVLTGHTETVNACAFSAYAAYRPYSDDSGKARLSTSKPCPTNRRPGSSRPRPTARCGCGAATATNCCKP